MAMTIGEISFNRDNPIPAAVTNKMKSETHTYPHIPTVYTRVGNEMRDTVIQWTPGNWSNQHAVSTSTIRLHRHRSVF